MQNGHMLKKSTITSSDSEDTTEPVASHSDTTDYKPPPQACDEDTSLPDALNHFYSRFEMQNDTPAQNCPHLPTTGRLCLSPADVRKTLSRINPRKLWVLKHTWPCTERLCCTADGCPNRYLQHLAEPGSCPHMSPNPQQSYRYQRNHLCPSK